MNALQIDNKTKAIEYMKSLDTTYKPALKPFFIFLETTGQDITPDSIQGYYEALRDSDYSANSIRIRRQACKYAVQELLDSTDLFNIDAQLKLEKVFRILNKKVKAPTIQNKILPHEKIITEEEFDLLMNSVTPLMSTFIYWLYSTGMRIFELCNIELKDCRIERDTVYIKTLGKGQKERIVQAPLEVFNYVNDFFKGSVYLFEHSGKQYNKHYISDRFKIIGKRYLNRRFHPHMMRHTYVTRLLKDGVPSTAIAEMVGHSSTAITAIYSHVTANMDQIRSALNMKSYSMS